MQKLMIVLVLAAFAFHGVHAQKYFTRNGKISFFSDAPLEKIEAVNNSATSVLDTETGRMEFAVLIKGFQFEKALMQEHFNENYMESGTYPKATFKGEITNADDVPFGRDGEYQAHVKGQMTLHGATNDIEVDGTFTVADGMIRGTSTFVLVVADYDIEVPGVVRDNIAKEVEVKVEMNYEPFNK